MIRLADHNKHKIEDKTQKQLKMAFQCRPVSAFRKRDVYKTEFDIFKSSTDIDLLSLISYKVDAPRSKFVTNTSNAHGTKPPSGYGNTYSGRLTKSARSAHPARYTDRKQFSHSAQSSTRVQESRYHRIDNFLRIRNARSKVETEIYKDFATSSKRLLKSKSASSADRRKCKSALDVRKSEGYRADQTRSNTTCGFHDRPNKRITDVTYTSDKSKVNTKQRESKFKPIVNRNSVTSVNNSWRAKTAIGCRQTNANTNKLKEHCYNSSENKETRYKNKIVTQTTNGSLSSEEVSLCRKDENRDTRIIQGNALSAEKYGRLEETTELNVNPNCINGSDQGSDKLSERLNGNFHNTDDKSEKSDFGKSENNTTVYDELKTGERYKSIKSNEEDEICEKVELFNSKDSGIDSHVFTPDLRQDITERDSVSSQEDETGHRHVTFTDDPTEYLLVPANSEDLEHLQLDSVSNLDTSLSGTVSEASIEGSEEASGVTGYNINDLINDLERFGNQSRLSTVSVGAQSLLGGAEEVNSLCCESSRKLQPEPSADQVDAKEIHTLSLEDFTMSREARHAILETLNEMRVKRSTGYKDNSANVLHQPVMVQNRLKENRNKYDHLIRERTKSVQRNQLRSLDSAGNEDESSQGSLPLHAFPHCDQSSDGDSELVSRLPSIGETYKPNKTTRKTHDKSKVFSLAQMKNKKYKIPGIGQYNLVTSPESDFEITPPGFDSRYNQVPIISKEETEIPPRLIREQSIQKCKRWLNNVNMSPVSLKPARRKTFE